MPYREGLEAVGARLLVCQRRMRLLWSHPRWANVCVRTSAWTVDPVDGATLRASTAVDDVARPQLVLVGGFLGAGKTSLVGEALRRLRQQVGAVTNDQAAGLVDTVLLSRNTRTIGEVAGSCFCCGLDALRRECDGLRNEGASVILAEAVGSCTDLVATVLGPLQQGYAGSDLRVAPLTVVADPRRLQRVIFNPRRSSLHSSAHLPEAARGG